MTTERHKKRKKTLPKMVAKQKTKHKNVTSTFMSITEMIKNMNKRRRTLKLKKNKTQNHKIITKTIQSKEKTKFQIMKRS